MLGYSLHKAQVTNLRQFGEFFARIRSYASTLNKQNRSVLDGIKQVFLQNPDFNWVAEQVTIIHELFRLTDTI